MIPKYIKLKEKINENILSGKYPIGSKLPTENQLAIEYQVSRSTVRQTLELLSAEGIITKRWGSGNTVISKSDSSKKKSIVLILNGLNKTSTNQFIEDVSSLLLKEGFRIETHLTYNSFQAERQILESMLSDVFGGVIVCPALSGHPSPNTDLYHLLLKRQTPIIFINSAPTSLYNTSIVSSDDYSRGYQMARQFINAGKKALGGIFLHDDLSSIRAYNGYIDAIRDANLTIYDSCFMWCNSVDSHGINTRSSGIINRFLKNAYNEIEAVYLDDSTITVDGSYPLYTCNLVLSHSKGREAAKQLMTLKKNGNCKSVTIPYKQY